MSLSPAAARKGRPQGPGGIKKNFIKTLEQVKSEHTGKKVEVWFQDESRFGQQGTITRVWARRGSRPRTVHQTKYDWLYVIGAVCPHSGQTVGLISPNIDTNIINIFTGQFIKEVGPNIHVVMLWDKAGFHTSGRLKIPENITILPLPSHSPELKPVENLWHYLSSHYWSNRAYVDYDDLRLAAVDGWRRAALNPEIVKSVCRAEYSERSI